MKQYSFFDDDNYQTYDNNHNSKPIKRRFGKRLHVPERREDAVPDSLNGMASVITKYNNIYSF